MRHQDLTWKPNFGKPPMYLVTFTLLKWALLGANPIKGYQNTLLGVTLLKDLNNPIRSGLVRGLETLQSRNVNMLEDLQNHC